MAAFTCLNQSLTSGDGDGGGLLSFSLKCSAREVQTYRYVNFVIVLLPEEVPVAASSAYS